MRIEIDRIAYYLPEKILTNTDLQKENPSWDMVRTKERTGVENRHIADSNETALDLSYRACKKLFSTEEQLKEGIDGIIFCTNSADYIMPSNSSVLHKELKLSDDVLAFDINLACSGFVYSLAVANGLIQSKVASKILLVNADTYSRYIHKNNRSARSLFGDAAAASVIHASQSSKGLIDIQCSTQGKGYNKFIIPAGGCRNPKTENTLIEQTDKSGNVFTDEDIQMDGMAILSFLNSKVSKQIKDILSKNGLAKEDIDLFVFHQASRIGLDSLTRKLDLDRNKVFSNIENIGNTVSASIPIALKNAQESGRIKPGHKVLISGFGVGLSWASAIIEF